MMTPGQARIALSSFLLVSAGVTINALFLQAKPATATRTAVERDAHRGARRIGAARATETADAGRTRHAPTPQARSARCGSRALHPTPPGSILRSRRRPTREADAETVRAIQRELKLRGYGPLGQRRRHAAWRRAPPSWPTSTTRAWR